MWTTRRPLGGTSNRHLGIIEELVNERSVVTGIAWYRRDQWTRLRELASDAYLAGILAAVRAEGQASADPWKLDLLAPPE